MIKKYKNLTSEINIELYTVGKIHIPTGVFEQEESVVLAIQKMTPVKLFEEYVEEEDEFEEPIPTAKRLEDFTNKELQDMCEEQGIEHSSKDIKAVLISKLRGE